MKLCAIFGVCIRKPSAIIVLCSGVLSLGPCKSAVCFRSFLDLAFCVVQPTALSFAKGEKKQPPRQIPTAFCSRKSFTNSNDQNKRLFFGVLLENRKENLCAQQEGLSIAKGEKGTTKADSVYKGIVNRKRRKEHYKS
ncbi:hypothetical protein KP509_18G002000 [Ceratopteris richardii]|uniref:Secreted protein n=1 Tax=Ceratopteris richardii TaxID=49495 RepID=A0A8T2SNP5_CERRI|nr:hypothetical protein KP509_18G002000 [Ceratopteris richardii]